MSAKWGISHWVLADSSNAYVVDFKIYAGRAEGGISQYGLGCDVVRKLMLDYEGQGYHLFFFIISILLSLLPATCMKGESFTQVRSLKQGGLCGWRGTPLFLLCNG